MTRGLRWGALAAGVVSIAVAASACHSGAVAPAVAPRPTAAPLPPPSMATSAPPASVPAASSAPAAPTTTSAAVVAVPVTSLAPVPQDAASLAAALATAAAAVADPATPLASLPDIGATEQRLLATLASHPDRRTAVLAALPPALRPAVSGSVGGDTELSAVPGPTPTQMPPWTIAAPRPADELLGDFEQAAAATGVRWTVLAAINLVETRMGRIVGPSSAGAQGPMQFLPATWARYGGGGDIHDAHDAILAAARLLRANGAARDLAAALYRYNPSTSYARGVLDFAGVMDAEPRAFYAFYGWRVYVSTTAGTFWLPEGYHHP